jgi:hypothetical protein
MDHIIPGITKIRVKIRGGRIVIGTFVKWNNEAIAQAEVILDNNQHRLVSVAPADIIRDGDEILKTVVAAQQVSPFTVAERFLFLEELSDMAIQGKTNSLIVTGDGGLGKSFTVTDRLGINKFFEGKDHTITKGHSSPKALYRALYENNGKLLVFDDCDSVLMNETATNILKGALDSTGKRVISWLTERVDDGLPQVFEFTGRAIFISNKRIEDFPQPLLSRSQFVDLSMTTDEKIERLEQLAPKIRPDVPLAIKNECVAIISKHRNSVKDLNIRSLIKVIQFAENAENLSDWKRLAVYSIITA